MSQVFIQERDAFLTYIHSQTWIHRHEHTWDLSGSARLDVSLISTDTELLVGLLGSVGGLITAQHLATDAVADFRRSETSTRSLGFFRSRVHGS